MENQPFFSRAGDLYQPNPVARGPWDEKSLHGRVLIGLLAHAIETRHGDETFIPARLTVDMYRLPDFSPAEVVTRVVRDGRRIKVIDAEYITGGVSQGRATCQLLLRTENPEGKVWSPPDWDAPSPDAIAPPEDQRSAMGGMWAVRPIVGAFGTVGPRRTWMSEVRELVGGVPLTPFVRVALASDFASPFANAGEGGLSYINSDVTLYLHRPLHGEWVGFEVVNHQATDGVAIGECWVHDHDGPIGSATVCALAQRKLG